MNSLSVMFVTITISLLCLAFRGTDSTTLSVSPCDNNVTNSELDYYWVDYNGGPMPKNALVVDKFPPNGPTYLGKVFTKNYELLPATIRTNRPYATFTAYGKVLHANKQIMVLCSHFPENFQWVPCNINTHNSVANKVPAGTEVSRELFFGLYYMNGVPIAGKIYHRIAIPYKGERKRFENNFYVLTYKKPQLVDCPYTQAVVQEPESTRCAYFTNYDQIDQSAN